MPDANYCWKETDRREEGEMSTKSDRDDKRVVYRLLVDIVRN
jgi:hypothetical protein